MTPDPPAPTSRKYTLKVTNGYNNAYMIKLVDNTNPFDSHVLDGGKITIGEYSTFEIETPLTGDFKLAFLSKAYNNSYPDYTDSYYDDSSIVSFSGTNYINLNSYAAGSTITVSISGTSGTVVS